MFNFFNKTDADVKRDVTNEIFWDPSVTSAYIKITANDGVVTLSGTVPHYSEKLAAENAAERVSGVKAVADEMTVKGVLDKSDEEIASAAVTAMKWNYSVPNDIKVSVDKGMITLSGQAEWDYQRNAAKNAVSDLLGVTGIINNITIKSKAQSSDVQTRIEEALKRSAESESKNIKVFVSGDKVTLTGKVNSIAESDDARLAAWMAPGITTVENNLTISQ